MDSPSHAVLLLQTEGVSVCSLDFIAVTVGTCHRPSTIAMLALVHENSLVGAPKMLCKRETFSQLQGTRKHQFKEAIQRARRAEAAQRLGGYRAQPATAGRLAW